MTNNFISCKAVAERLGLTADYIRRLIAMKKIKAQKLGREWMIDINSIKNIKRQRSPRGYRKSKGE